MLLQHKKIWNGPSMVAFPKQYLVNNTVNLVNPEWLQCKGIHECFVDDVIVLPTKLLFIHPFQKYFFYQGLFYLYTFF